MKKKLNNIKVITLELIDVFKSTEWYEKIYAIIALPFLWVLITIILLFENPDYLDEDEISKPKLKIKTKSNYDL